MAYYWRQSMIKSDLPFQIEIDERVKLISVSKFDTQELLKKLDYFKDRQVELYLGWEDSLEDEVINIKERNETDSKSKFWIIERDGLVIGLFYLYDMHLKYKRAKISLGIIKEYRGYVLSIKRIRKLLETLLDLGFVRLGLEIEPDNDASIKIAKHLSLIGFQYEGTIRNNYGEGIHSMTYSLISSEYVKDR